MPYQGLVSDIPEKWHLCDGTNGTPDLRDGRFLEGSSSAKSLKSAGLPNIKGTFTTYTNYISYWSASAGSNGAFSWTITKKKPLQNGTGNGDTVEALYFNAHDSNPIYSDSVNTVQPKSYTVLYIMKIKA